METQNIVEFEINMKYKTKPSKLITIQTSKDIADVLRTCFDSNKIEWVEEFIVIALNRANKVTGFYKISSGGISATVADPRVIFQFALLSNATNIIIAHNHPSGNLQPSYQDLEMTQKIKDAGIILQIKVLDHLIVTSEGYYSFKDNGDI